MGYEKFKRGVRAPSFSPSPDGLTLSDMPQGTDGQLIVARTGLAPRYVALSGDATIDNAGVLTLVAGHGGVAEVDLSAANLIAMNGAPVQILAAPGAGKAIVVDSILVSVTRTATAFTGGGAVSFQYHTTTTSVPHAGSIPATLVTGAAGVAQYALGPNVGTNGLVVPANEGIDITNATAAFADGTGTAKIFIKYRIITL